MGVEPAVSDAIIPVLDEAGLAELVIESVEEASEDDEPDAVSEADELSVDVLSTDVTSGSSR